MGQPPNRKYYYKSNNFTGDELQVVIPYTLGIIQYYAYLHNKALLFGMACSDGAQYIVRDTAFLRIDWTLVDTREHDNVETIIGALGEVDISNFDIIVVPRLLEYVKKTDDELARAFVNIYNGLSVGGIAILSMPIGINVMPIQASTQIIKELLKPFHIIDERYWLWDGDFFVAAEENDVSGYIYQYTNQAPAASAVGAWTLER